MMCQHHDEVTLLVPVHGSEAQWTFRKIDRCIAPLVQALNDAKIYTASCCCGQGEELGHIWLQDGRALIILPDATKDGITNLVKAG